MDEKNLGYRFLGELRMNVSKLTPGAFAVTDTFNLDTSSYFPGRQVTGDLTVSVSSHPGNTNRGIALQSSSLHHSSSLYSPALS